MNNQDTTSVNDLNQKNQKVVPIHKNQEPISPNGLTWFKDVFRKQFNNLQDWINFIGVLFTIIALVWGVFTWSIDSRFDAMDKKLDAVNLQNQANYEKISAEIKGGNLDLQNRIQNIEHAQKSLNLDLKYKK